MNLHINFLLLFILTLGYEGRSFSKDYLAFFEIKNNYSASTPFDTNTNLYGYWRFKDKKQRNFITIESSCFYELNITKDTFIYSFMDDEGFELSGSAKYHLHSNGSDIFFTSFDGTPNLSLHIDVLNKTELILSYYNQAKDIEIKYHFIKVI